MMARPVPRPIDVNTTLGVLADGVNAARRSGTNVVRLTLAEARTAQAILALHLDRVHEEAITTRKEQHR